MNVETKPNFDDIYYFDAKSLGKHIGQLTEATSRLRSLSSGKDKSLFHDGVLEGIKIMQDIIIEHMKIDEAKLQLDSFIKANSSVSGGQCNSQP